MTRGPEWPWGGTGPRLYGGADFWGSPRARAAGPRDGGGGSASAGGWDDLGTRGLGLAGAMDTETTAMGLSSPSLSPLVTGPLVA